ncbi:hypothetical protein PDE_04975 [Penicillium oxalicum 114-2]|uniref:Uncharacterized protein n=1 Tax=Penicillium oxalicum (strain 114-2 / CGMCC 5302) TaxID=933388 RepID=S7ZH70_PENO1|nr:hypothetical protein PDE_04975 [Penicillium oxalicum 114-2]
MVLFRSSLSLALSLSLSTEEQLGATQRNTEFGVQLLYLRENETRRSVGSSHLPIKTKDSNPPEEEEGMGMPSFHPFSPTRLDCVRLRDEKFAVKVCAPSSHLARKVSIHPEWDWTVHPSSAATEIHLEPSHRDPGLTEYFGAPRIQSSSCPTVLIEGESINDWDNPDREVSARQGRSTSVPEGGKCALSANYAQVKDALFSEVKEEKPRPEWRKVAKKEVNGNIRKSLTAADSLKVWW